MRRSGAPSAEHRAAHPPRPIDGSDPGAAIELRGVTKAYPRQHGDKRAVRPSVDSVDLAVRRGEIYGLLGPNGAGKSTIVRMISTLLEPTSGEVLVDGLDTVRQTRRVRSLLGVALGGERSLYWKLTARQNLEFFSALHGVRRRAAQPRIMSVLDQVQLLEHIDEHIERWSTGMRQRLVLARALINEPRVLVLDEPASGLDPRAAATLHELVAGFRDRGHTILLTTHDMAEADLLSDRVGIIDRGRLVGEGTPAGLKSSIDGQEVVRTRVSAPGTLDVLVADLRGTRGIQVSVATPSDDGAAGDVADLSVIAAAPSDPTAVLIAATRRHGAQILALQQDRVTLREVFLELTGRGLPDAGA